MGLLEPNADLQKLLLVFLNLTFLLPFLFVLAKDSKKQQNPWVVIFACLFFFVPIVSHLIYFIVVRPALKQAQ